MISSFQFKLKISKITFLLIFIIKIQKNRFWKKEFYIILIIYYLFYQLYNFKDKNN